MRYCPHCRRFNEGEPKICNFCGRTWHVRLCPRGHENPFNAQFCGTCGSTDLSETACRSWFFIALKTFFLFFIALSAYFILAALCKIIFPFAIHQLLFYFIPVFLFIIGIQLILSMLPGSIGKGIWAFSKQMMKFIIKAIGWFLIKIWEMIK